MNTELLELVMQLNAPQHKGCDAFFVLFQSILYLCSTGGEFSLFDISVSTLVALFRVVISVCNFVLLSSFYDSCDADSRCGFLACFSPVCEVFGNPFESSYHTVICDMKFSLPALL